MRESFQAGQAIFEEGSTGDSLYILLSGEAVVHKIVDAEEGETLTIGTVQPGDMSGEMSLFEHLPPLRDRARWILKSPRSA